MPFCHTCSVYRGWPASLPYIRKMHVSVAIGIQSGIRLHERVPMAKIWASSKNDQNRITGKLFTIFPFVVVVLLLQFQPPYLKTRTNETCTLIELGDDHCNVMLVNNVVLVKQPQAIYYDRNIDGHVIH